MLLKSNTSIQFNTISVILEKGVEKFLKSAEYMNSQREKELSKFQQKAVQQKKEAPKTEKSTPTSKKPETEEVDLLG